MNPSHRRALDRARRNWLFLAAVATWLVLCGYQLERQIIIFDEWHTLISALTLDAREIFSSLGEHSSIPVSLYFRALVETVGLGEAQLRIPFVLGGLCILVSASLIARRLLGRPAGDTLAWFLALSPLLVYHSRFARQYALATPCALLAIAFAYRWWQRGRARDAVAYAVLTAAAGFFTPAHLAFPVSVFLFFFADWALDPRRRNSKTLAGLILLGAATVALLALLLGPALLHDSQTLQSKIMLSHQPFRWMGVIRVASGMVSEPLGGALLSLSFVGVWTLWSADRRVCIYLLLAVFAQVLSVFVLEPRSYGHPQVFCRYILPAIIVIYGFVAAGLWTLTSGLASVVPGAPLRARAWLARYGALLAILALVPFGPIPLLFVQPNDWPNELMMSRLMFPDVDPKKTTKRFSQFYRELAARPPDSVTLIEAPYSGFGLYAPYPSYQLRHRQRVWVASESGACEAENTNPFRHHPGMALHNVFYLAEPQAIDESGADYLVVHRNPAPETSFYRPDSWHGKNLRMAGEECVEFAKARWGAPVFEDEDLAVFTLPGLLSHE